MKSEVFTYSANGRDCSISNTKGSSIEDPFSVPIIVRYVNRLCIRYTSKNLNKSVLSNGTIRKIVGCEGETI